jgi:hypothetical protein
VQALRNGLFEQTAKFSPHLLKRLARVYTVNDVRLFVGILVEIGELGRESGLRTDVARLLLHSEPVASGVEAANDVLSRAVVRVGPSETFPPAWSRNG